jgi:hypothetical protein
MSTATLCMCVLNWMVVRVVTVTVIWNTLTYLITYLLTYSKAQGSSWESNWFTASQEIPRISRNPKVHYRTHKRPPTVSILGQPNPVHIPTSNLLEIRPNNIHLLRLGLPSGYFPPGSPSTSYTPPLLTNTRHMFSPYHSSRIYHPQNIGWRVKSFSSSSCSSREAIYLICVVFCWFIYIYLYCCTYVTCCIFNYCSWLS